MRRLREGLGLRKAGLDLVGAEGRAIREAGRRLGVWGVSPQRRLHVRRVQLAELLHVLDDAGELGRHGGELGGIQGQAGETSDVLDVDLRTIRHGRKVTQPRLSYTPACVKAPYREPSPSGRPLKVERILVATDLGPGAGAVLGAAATLAQGLGAKVHIVYVLEALMYTPPDMQEAARRDPDTHPEATRKLADAIHRMRALGVQDADGAIEFGIAVDVVLEKVGAGGFDVLVTGSRPRGHFAQHVLATSKIPVLTVPLP
jgi:nucleotide-binding universal stress UspA family protein